MKLILLSGGSGKRLWPLSNESRSKQFLKVLKREDGTMESMVQRVWRQLGRAGLAEHAYVATGTQQAEMIKGQLGDVPVVLEPSRRDTFPAIALTAVYLYSIEGVSLNEMVAVLPVDPYVEDRFFPCVAELESVLERSGASLALMGVKPVHPSEKYGYIVPRESETSAGSETASSPRLVERFTEKPTQAEAEALISQGALWNCGVFAFRLGYLIDLLIEKQIPLHFEELSKHYDKLPKISFDYEVVEKASPIAVMEYDGYWKDLGTWNTLTEEMEPGIIGKGVLGENSDNTHVINELGVPIVVMGLPNVVVTASPDGILVADKQTSPRIKEVVGSWDDRPMFEERLWGSYRVLDYNVHEDGIQSMVRRIHIEASKHLSYHFHASRSETWTIVSGEGEMVMDGSWRKLYAGDTVYIPPYAKHSVLAVSDLVIVEVQSGSDLSDEDLFETSVNWKEISAQ
ncbi:sugar phosphate nucleotidyltransferase [Cohnella faecalis]|uniref:Cupin domain-containing protein n=1 Tax=Cohnella faecalis TaxID=2315694 RepID=A0A398CRB9_9BACL|nr:sugar phosphate nucleotidyltransferase [Cohnella faecalis]RIE03809.1 cupin domain-containing protein [Cohnella faecalis]